MKFKLIQIFRGVAALLVVLHHLIANSKTYFGFTPMNNFFNFGFVGVDFFFILSGFIITYIHFSDLTVTGDWASFFKKRALRIYPIYWVAATVALIVYINLTPTFFKQQGVTMDLTSPLILWSVIKSYLLIPSVIRLVGPSWTLSYEILFYLVFGIGIIAGYRSAKFILSFWITGILINALLIHTTNYYLDFIFNILVLEFVLGCVVAYLILHKHTISLKWLFPLLTIIFIIMLNKIHIRGIAFRRDLIDVLLLGSFFAIITFITIKFDQKNPNIKYPKVFMLIGDGSYSIYLFHNMFLSGLCRIYIKLNPQFKTTINLEIIALILVIITVTLGVLIHVLIERKMTNFLYGRFLKKKVSIWQQPDVQTPP